MVARQAIDDKRGYVIAPYGEVTIDGFRTSLDQVATFRFSSVRDSYAGRKGQDRNVGVIGVAFFPEREHPIAIAPRQYYDDRPRALVGARPALLPPRRSRKPPMGPALTAEHRDAKRGAGSAPSSVNNAIRASATPASSARARAIPRA